MILGSFQKHLSALKSKSSWIFKFHQWIKATSFNVWVRYFVWNFKSTLWNSAQNILTIYWKIWFLNNIEILRALRFKSSYAFLKRPWHTPHPTPPVSSAPHQQVGFKTNPFYVTQAVAIWNRTPVHETQRTVYVIYGIGVKIFPLKTYSYQWFCSNMFS